MPSVAVKLYSVFFKVLFKLRLQSLQEAKAAAIAAGDGDHAFGVAGRPDESVAAANPLFASDGVATKDIHIDPFTSLTVRIFLPDSCLAAGAKFAGSRIPDHARRSSVGPGVTPVAKVAPLAGVGARRSSYGGGGYMGYAPAAGGGVGARKLPMMLQFHGGGFVSGSSDSAANDLFCRRVAKLCDVIVFAVGYRLAPENRYPAAFEDGLKVLNWLGKQAKLADCRGADHVRKGEVRRHIVDGFGASMVEPWLAAHADPSRCVLLGVSCGSNIANFVARKAVEAGKHLEPIKIVAQVLMYPFFMGSIPTHSEIKLANSYFYNKAMCIAAWKLFLPEEEFSLDHSAANPLIPANDPLLKSMPPTLTVVAEHDLMRDRAIAYASELRKMNIDAPVLEYKDAVHEFATLDMLLKSPQALACAEDIAIWVKKYISIRGHEFSY